MSDEEIERIARELQAQPLTFPGTVQPWDYITEKSKEGSPQGLCAKVR